MSRAAGSRRGIIRRDTNAIHWLKQHTRVPLPTSLRWDLKTRPDLKWMATAARQLWRTARKRTAFYWLDASGQSKALLGDEIAVVLHRKKNVIEVKKAHRYVRILLTPAMLDLTRPLQIKIQGQRLRWQAKASLRTMVTSLLQRGDPRLMFEAVVCLRRRAGRWTASGC